MPKISVIVPVYKVEKYLNRCIDSILGQTYQDFELILVDDGSPDKCGVMCDQIAKTNDKVVVIHKENGGLSSARNAGINKAKGEFLCFVDSDDWISSDMFEHMIDLQQQKQADIVSVSYCLTKGMPEKRNSKTEIRVFSREEALLYYMKEGMAKRIADYPVCIKMFKAELFQGVCFPEHQLFEDTATNLVLLKKVHCYVKSSKVCYYYFQDSTSILRSSFKMQDHTDLMKTSNQMIELLQDETPEIKKLAYEKKARTYFSTLSKIALYGVDKSVSEPDRFKWDMLKQLKKNYSLLMKSDMPVNRKILMNCFLISFPLCEKGFAVYRHMAGRTR